MASDDPGDRIRLADGGFGRLHARIVVGTLLQSVVDTARRDPTRPALDSPEGTVDFGTLVAASQDLAARLSAAGYPRGAAVGVHFSRSASFVAAALAGWMLGAPIVPLSRSVPVARRRRIIEHARIEWLFGDTASLGEFDLLLRHVANVDWSAPPTDETIDHSSTDDVAYLIYTSGSTGAPKAARIRHDGLMNTLRAQVRIFGIESTSRVLWALEPGFDASFSDIGTALLAGATLVIEPEPMAELGATLFRRAIDRGVTHADVPPSLLSIFDADLIPFEAFTIVIGGEVCPASTIRAWAGRCRLFNVYGPTETSICSSVARATEDWDRAWIGRPLENVEYRVVDDELWIGGVAVADGYLFDPEQTAARFVELDGVRYFRTGDRVRRHDDGRYEFLGRIDRQLKLRGQLVAPEEIESTLAEHPAVRAALVQPTKGTSGRVALHATVELEARRAVRSEALRAFLMERLPSWMVPSRIVCRDAVPRNENLKSDPTATLTPSTPVPATSADIEMVRRVFCEVLEAEVGPDDDFFEAGGDSLGLLHLVSALSAMGWAVNVDRVRLHPTPRSLAACTSEDTGAHGAMSTDVLKERAGLPHDWDARPARSNSTEDASAIFVTGATGFLGQHFVRELLGQSDAIVYCLVRAPDDRAAAARLEAISKTPRLRAVRGDLTKPRLGLTSEAWTARTEDCAEVFHLAANTSVSATYRDLEAANVFGTTRVLDFAATTRPKRLHYASTLSVFVSSDANTGHIEEARELERVSVVFGGYAQTKWVAEYLCTVARRVLPAIAIYRFGLLTGDAQTGRMNPNDLLVRFLRGLHERPRLAHDARQLALDITPVDYAARAFVALSRSGRFETFHVANTKALSLEAMVEALRTVGWPIEWVEEDTLLPTDALTMNARLAQTLANPKLRAAHRSVDLFQATGASFGRTRADAVLKPLGIDCPPAHSVIECYARALVAGC